MSEPKHTPGPWIVSGLGTVYGENGDLVTTVFRGRDVTLIAAAPELLDALEGVISEGPGPMDEYLYEMCCDAVKKAGGETAVESD